MSVKLMSAIFETEFRDLQDSNGDITKASTAKLVLLAMADHANDEGEGSYPSIETLCRKTALSAQTIRNTWDALKHNGIIFLAGESKYRTNNHTINTNSFPKLRGENSGILNLNPLEGLTGNDAPSNQSHLTLNPLDPNHQLTTNKPSSKGDEILFQSSLKEREQNEACKAFDNAFGSKMPWNSTGIWSKMTRFVTDIYKADRFAFGNYVIWRGNSGKYTAMSNTKIRTNPQIFMDTNWLEFENTQTHKTDEVRPEYQPFPFLDGA